ncbi:Receptor-like protein 43 [Linum perenne]
MKHHLLTLLLLLIPVSLVAGRCQENQQSLLLQLKHGLNFSRSFSQKLVEWNASTECCEWPGIRCDSGVLGRVIGLNLSYESITGGGGIDNSVALFNLQYLKVLDLSFNHFNTTVPAALANLTNLRYLNLSAGSFFGQVPASFSRMTSLVGLDLSRFAPRLKLEKPNLALLVRNLTQLTDLRLDGVNLSAQGKEWCQALSPSLRNLKVLSMSRCNLSGPIDPSLSKLKSLSIVELKENNFSSPFPDSFAELRNLTSLSLMSCELIGKFPAKTLGSLTQLEHLDFSFNNFTGPIPRFIFELETLEALYLSTNRFSVIDNHPLGYLSLSNNSLTGPIPTSICNFANLEVLDLSDNYYEDSITLSNKGHQTEYVKILEVFKSIDFSSNNFDGTIPQVMGKFTALQILNLSHNAFTSQIPSVLGNLSNLESLDLSNNRLTGRIPKELADMSFLAVLNLSDNNLNGSIPIGSQFQTFDNTSFGGNPNLCGQPLFKSCFAPPAPPKIIVGESTTSINWDLLSKAFGFIFGLGVVMLPAALWPSFRVWYWPKIDYLLIWMFPKIYLKDRNNRLRTRRRQQRRSKQTMTSSQQNHSPAISCT